MYTCGPTVWNHAHIGNFRTFLFYDLLRRHLELSGFRVTHVMNLTDIDDRIIAGAAREGTTAAVYADRYTRIFHEDLQALRIRPATVYPRASDHVPEMIDLIERLRAAGHAYSSDGDVYFRIGSFPAYGALSHLDQSGLRAGARVRADDYDKESVSDFALWKASQPGDDLLGVSWRSPFGDGRPGWHIECSAMSMSYLGETFDIHGGGIDLLFPHHENEVAQSEAVTRKPLARFWLHSEHLSDATGEKMSKRLGNIATLRDLTDAGHDAVAIRFFLMANAHYRSKLRFDERGIIQAADQVQRLREVARRTEVAAPSGSPDPGLLAALIGARDRYRAALDDDLNLPQAVGHLFDAVRVVNAALDRGGAGSAEIEAMRLLLSEADSHLDVLDPGEESLDAEVERLIAEREEARRNRDFARSDSIRDELRARGIALEDSRDGVRWHRART